MTTPQDYTLWRALLAGENPPRDINDPAPGFYRVRRNGSFMPVAYWYDDDEVLRCLLGRNLLDDLRAREIWPYASKGAISYETYHAVRAGAEWPDLHEAVSRSNRAPEDDSFEAIRDRIEDLAREAALIAGCSSQHESDRAADLANELGKLEKRAEARRRAEKEPHEQAGREVDQKWSPWRDKATTAKQHLKGLIAAFLKANVTESPRAATTAGTRGRPVSLRTVKHVAIVDRAALLAHFAESDAITATLQSLAEKSVRAGVTPPGVAVTAEQVAA